LAEFVLAEAAKELAELVLLFFAGQRPDLWHAMWANIRPSNQTSPNAIGRLWSEEACATAWQIYSACDSAEHRDKVLDTLYDLKP
ncbi:hypothetical protein ABN034_23055, partial [Actinopolymorpha sp. B11F2]|uniref:hypothetical protein n=1 Tax=Actinopolymorpha sp. B11F2 TaxID=3160862 RepID=UPI0032E3CEB8